ncbi:MAG: Peptidyl-prolyl cis-trans isomerase [Parcubacteria group bacterium GW2011_GWA1_33_6]|nr:MAG: Peptidyl-prolyl cis-trans isomerase [Parcubacteria group bacterium GW2011_GWA2_33_14]KKP54618.1 MAG: Peptidyl-prolyl cis-trans isomerase [Parcubacteria group bacterium GW2011_GWA1_33_6]
MQKIILIVIAVLLVVLVIWGIYFLISSSNQNVVPNNNNQNTNGTDTNNFEIQGMKVQVLAQGQGPQVKKDDIVTVHYVGTLQDGTKFDSSIDRNAPFSFPVGQGRVIAGWDLAIIGMKVGEKRKLTIPPELGYGKDGFINVIPPDATLTFEVELLGINTY